ncbi:unnamed protein product [Caenorhabditis auriculariae]|uniref:CHK kinase-like domain-containing protein n=1 Tax=Caenorhabditis auriculariae TaxID=2777116 RepID=A0A8S1GTV6_9PELO|nr:unnamed protein product [Caenorhabditis auriculariae]
MTSLMQEGVGLFGTHVVKDDIEEAVQKKFGSRAVFGPDAEFVVVGDGNGFISRVVLVTPKWQGDAAGLPEKFILKIISMQNTMALGDKMKENESIVHMTPEEEEALWKHFEGAVHLLHNREVNLYKVLETYESSADVLAPKIFFSKSFEADTKGFIGMEAVEDVKIRHVFVNSKPHQLLPLMNALATLEACGLKMTEEEKSSISGFDYKTIFGTMLTDENVKRMFLMLKNNDEKRFGETADRLAEYGLELVHDDDIAGINKNLGMKDVLIHGDLWSANILWVNKGEEDEIAKVIDYQLVHFGNPAEDLVRVFVSTLSGTDRRQHWEWLVEKFYGYLEQKLDGSPVPYTLDQLKESYKRFFVFGAVIMAGIFGPVAETALQNRDDDGHEERREVISEKVQALLEDTVKYHLRNLEIHPERRTEKTETSSEIH